MHGDLQPWHPPWRHGWHVAPGPRQGPGTRDFTIANVTRHWSARVAVLHPSCSDGMVALSILVHTLSIWIRMSRGNGKRHRAMIADTVGSQHAWVVRRFSPFVDGMSSTTSIGTLLTSEDALISDWVKLGEDMHTSAWVILGTSDNDERSRFDLSEPPTEPSQPPSTQPQVLVQQARIVGASAQVVGKGVRRPAAERRGRDSLEGR